QAPHPSPLAEGRGAVKLEPLRPRSGGERALRSSCVPTHAYADAVAPRAKTPSADTVAAEGTGGTDQNQRAADARAFLRLVGSTLAFIPVAERLQALTWCQEIAAVST